MSDPRDEATADTGHAPFDLDIEQAVLGTMLKDSRRIDEVAADLEARHFHDPYHQRLFDMAVYLQTEGPVTPLTIGAVMKTDAGFQETGGADYLRAMVSAAPSLPNMRELTKILQELAFRRDLIRVGRELAEAALESPVDAPAQQLADQATEELLQAGRAGARRILTPYEIAMETVRELEDIRTGKPIPGVKTGIEKLDREIGVLRGGDLITILGKSGMGKSALMGTLALNFARAGIPTMVFSLEMTRRQWVERMVCDLDFDTACDEGWLPMWYSRVRNGRLSEAEFDRFLLGSQRLQNLPLEICDEDGLTMAQISARARAFKAKHGKNDDGSEKIGAIIGDYFQIVEAANPKDNRERQVAMIARGAKSLAKRLVWPVIFGSQMNENDEGRTKEERRPRASDARESKAIMNESDLMLAPYRPVVAVENRKPMDARPGDAADIAWKAEIKEVRHRFELMALKNRHGRRFDLDLWAEMGSSAIRDQEPGKARQTRAAEESGADLLEGVA